MISLSPYTLLVLAIFLAIAQPITYKIVSMRLNHRSSPIFTSLWVLIGLAIVSPWYGHLLIGNFEQLKLSYYLWGFITLKAVLLYFGLYKGQELIQHSLSASKFILPTSLGFIAIINSFLGETLKLTEWVAALGLCALGIAFCLRGHLQELAIPQKMLFFQLIILAIIIATLDFLILKQTNWYILLLFSNLLILMISICIRSPIKVWKQSLLTKEAMIAGSIFSMGELLKFYLMVSIIPMTVVISAQVSVIPIILILSSLIWGERQWKEQLLWGGLSVTLLLLLFL